MRRCPKKRSEVNTDSRRVCRSQVKDLVVKPEPKIEPREENVRKKRKGGGSKGEGKERKEIARKRESRERTEKRENQEKEKKEETKKKKGRKKGKILNFTLCLPGVNTWPYALKVLDERVP